ncbi:hypothetical protein QBC37DRAFT_170580 [Rhypophila decipiens]|uniref:Uncharacterized protein n=1 Tax=Rhypophila decipiens TaxID=261697 RepID=A0AAN6Y7G4_9PEZI|nr:hypothetical protein QBC37DRAFT_170580 [Rhypophila decipiens]
MNLFGAPAKRARTVWHQHLISSGAHLSLFGSQPLDTLPLDRLRQAAETYVNRAKLIPDTESCDVHLNELIVEHTHRDRGGLKDVAVLSCLHLLSHDAGSGNLLALRDECENMARPEHPRFLRCLIKAREASPFLVSEQEHSTAKALMHLLKDTNFLDSVNNLFLTMQRLVNPAILQASYIIKILDSINFRSEFQQRLEDLKAARRYMSLYKAVNWIRPMTTLQDTCTAKAVCRVLVPDWEDWTAWKPNRRRIMHWEGVAFADGHKPRLSRVFDLEGPDPSGYGFEAVKKSMRGGCFRHIPVLNSEIELLERVLELLDLARETEGRHAVELFLFLLVENKNPVDRHLLELTQTILETRNDSCIKAVWMWLSSWGGSSNNNRMVALTRLLPALEARTELQQSIGGHIANDVVQTLHGAKEEYGNTVGVAENLALAIHGLAKAVLDATWLRQILDNFDETFVPSLEKFPPQDVLYNMFNSMQRLRAPVPQIEQYLGIVFGGKEGDAAALLTSIQKTIRFLADGVHADRASLALAIHNLQDIDDDVSEACSKQILVEDLLVVQDILKIFTTRDSNRSRTQYHSHVRFSQFLAGRARKSQRLKLDHCWYMLLFSLLLPKGQEIMTWSAQALPVEEWNQWLSNLRLLFPRGERLSVTNLGISPQHSAWWDLLSIKYKNAVSQLEEMHKARGMNLKWLFFQETDNITDLLDLLQREDSPSSFQNYLVSRIKERPYLYVVRLVCMTLAAVNQASPQGQTAFQSIYARHKQATDEWWTREATEALTIAWRQSHEITESDREGLAAFSELLGLGPTVDSNGLHFARQAILSDHARIMALAQELEQMRANLQNDDAARTTAFLAELGVEDAMPGADPSIPAKLSSVVEALGDRQYEISFPLNHLSGLKRRAAAIDEASRMVLVRVSFQNQQPSFCVHFSPNDDGSGRDHTPLIVSGEAPNSKICTTKPTLLSYLLNRKLSGFLSQAPRDIVSVHEMVSAVLRAPGQSCVVCSRPMGCKLWRPSFCTDTCGEIFQRAPIEVRTCHLINEPPILDLLLSSIYAAAGGASSASVDLLPGCPIPKANLRTIIDSFPRLISNTSAAQLLSLIRGGPDPMAVEREQLLSWMSLRFRGCLMTTSSDLRIPSMPGVVQFMMLNAPPEREQAFSHYVALSGVAEHIPAGGVTFHGTAIDRLWRITTEGLRNVGGNRGIALADEASMALQYSGSLGGTGEGEASSSWSKSSFVNRRLVLACELVGHSRQGMHIVSEEARVAVRYVLLCPDREASGQEGQGGRYRMPVTASGEVNETVRGHFVGIRTGELGR